MTFTSRFVLVIGSLAAISGASAAAVPFAPAGQARQERYEAQRDEWQKPSEIVQAMGAVPGGVVADIGAGDGYFTVRLAEAVGDIGTVYAVDVSAQQVERLMERLAGEPFTNVEVIRSEPHDPGLPAGALDAALIVNAYHEMREHESMLVAILRALKPGGRLVIEDQIAPARRSESRAVQVESHEIAPELVEAELTRAGFEVVERRDPFTRSESEELHWLIVARKPSP